MASAAKCSPIRGLSLRGAPATRQGHPFDLTATGRWLCRVAPSYQTRDNAQPTIRYTVASPTLGEGMPRTCNIVSVFLFCHGSARLNCNASVHPVNIHLNVRSDCIPRRLCRVAPFLRPTAKTVLTLLATAWACADLSLIGFCSCPLYT